MKKIDTRSLTPAARDEFRKMVIRLRQQSGMNAAALGAIAGLHPGTVLKWLARARNAGEGTLTGKPRGRPVGSCRKLTLAQELWVRETDIGQNPKQLLAKAMTLMTRLQTWPERVRSYFQHPAAQYADQPI